MDRLSPPLILVSGYIVYQVYNYFRRVSIANIPGPEPESFWLGNYRELFQSLAGEIEFKWQEEYGNVIRIKSILGEDVLLLSDPKALQYILQTSSYYFLKMPERRELSRIVGGRGLLWSDGDIHRRQRKVMLPGFSGPQAKGGIPTFFHDACELSEQWRGLIKASEEESTVIDVPPWTNRATLDSIGKVAFDYEFGQMNNADSPLAKTYMNVMLDTFGKLSTSRIFSVNFARFIPGPILRWMNDKVSNPKLEHVRAMTKLADEVAGELIETKLKDIAEGKAKKDILSILVQANESGHGNMRLTQEELMAQMRNILLAGHETTSNTLSFMLLELARNPKVQERLRKEIWEMEARIAERGETGFSGTDLDNMTYLNAFLRESLRMHPAVNTMFRQSARDDVLPLAKPFVDRNGKTITSLPIPKNQRILVSVGNYNRDKDIFGEDAHAFDPSRWLDSRVKATASVGVIGNLLSFSAGARSCIGWRYAVVELQSFLVELVRSFEFSMTPEAEKVRREAALVMLPTIEGQVEKGAQLPLRVKATIRD